MALEHIDRDFGKAVRALRLDRGMSQEELSDEVSSRGYPLSQATIGKIERGDRKVTVGEASAIAEALHTSTSELVLGPSFVNRELLAERLQTLRRELIAAVEAFDSGRALVAIEATDLDDYDQEWLRDAVLESAEEAIDGYRKDILVKNDADDRREEMDGPLTRRTPSGLFGEYSQKFGNRVSGVIHPHAAEVILRRSADEHG